MSYLNPDLGAQQVIERLIKAPTPTKAVWIRTSLLSPSNRHPRKIKMIGHLLAPLTQNTLCRLFFLTNNDIIIIGKEDIASLCLPQIDRIKQVISDDALLTSLIDSFFTVYDIKTQNSLLLNALSNLQSQDENVPVGPLLFERAITALKKIEISNFIHFYPVICLTLKQKHETHLQIHMDWTTLYQKLGMAADSIPSWIVQEIKILFYQKMLDQPDLFPSLGLPLILPVEPQLVTKDQFDFFCHNKKDFLIVAWDAASVLSNEKYSYAALKKLHQIHVPWALECHNPLLFKLMDFSKLQPDLILMPLTSETLNLSIDPALLKKIILTHTTHNADLIESLRLGFTHFEGPLMSLIKADACQKTCPYSDACPAGLCAKIIQNKAPESACVFPSYRAGFIFSETEAT